MSNKPQNTKKLFSEVKRLIEEAKQNVAKIEMQRLQHFIGVLALK